MAADRPIRIPDDLPVLPPGVCLPAGGWRVVPGVLFSLVAAGAAVASLLVDNDWFQVGLLGVILMLGPAGLFLRAGFAGHPAPEIATQVVLSITCHSVVWIAACGFTLATMVGPTVGTVRTALLHATSFGILALFTAILVRGALGGGGQSYCFGLVFSTVLAGIFLPMASHPHSYPLAHSLMAVGFLGGAILQWVQMRRALPSTGPF